MKSFLGNLRIAAPAAALAALIASGCVLVSGQFIVTYEFADAGYDPLYVNSPTSLVGVQVDLNDVGDYTKHKDKLQDVVDLALVGSVTNQLSTPTSVEVWMVATPGAPLTTESAVKSAGVRLWGPLALPGSGTVKIDWNRSAGLFVGRKALIDQIKGDGRFDLYAIGTTAEYAFRVDKGALIAVLSARN